MSALGRAVVYIWLFAPVQILLGCLTFGSIGKLPLMSALFVFLAFIHIVVTLDQIKKRGVEIQKVKKRQSLIGFLFGISFAKALIQSISHPERMLDSFFLFFVALPYVLFLGPLPDRPEGELARPS